MRRCKATIWEDRKQVPVEGLFHQWAQQYEDGGEAGIGNYTTAIIELDDGRIVEAAPDTVVFLDRPPSIYPVSPIGTWWWRRPLSPMATYCKDCERPCQKAYLSSSLHGYISGNENMPHAPATDAEVQK